MTPGAKRMWHTLIELISGDPAREYVGVFLRRRARTIPTALVRGA